MILPIGDEGITKKIDKLLLFFYINLNKHKIFITF